MRPLRRPTRAQVTAWAWSAKVLEAAVQVHALVEKQRAAGVAPEALLEGHEFASAWSDLKSALHEAQDGQCVWCGLRVRDGGSYGCVDHLRPKARVNRDLPARGGARRPSTRPSGLRRPGYWWRAYDSDNLALVCEECNTNKRDYWPVSIHPDRSGWDDPASWSAPQEGQIEHELALDPFDPNFDPAAHFDVLLDGSLLEREGDLRAAVTIELVCLNRAWLTKPRAVDPAELSWRLAAIQRAQLGTSPQAETELVAHLIYFAKGCAWSTPHALSFRAALGSALSSAGAALDWPALRSLWDAHGLAPGITALPTLL